MFDERTMLEYHLRYNHFPALPLPMVDTVLEAIALARLGEMAATVTLPDGLLYQGKYSEVDVLTLLQSVHLDPDDYEDVPYVNEEEEEV